MPLEKGKSKKAFKDNVEKLMGEVGKSPHVKNQKQALAIAYAEKGEKEEKKEMTYYSNIPTILAQQDFNNRHADMLASARGEVFIGLDFGSKDKTHYWFSDINPVEENVFYRMWRENPEPKVGDKLKIRILNPDGSSRDV